MSCGTLPCWLYLNGPTTIPPGGWNGVSYSGLPEYIDLVSSGSQEYRDYSIDWGDGTNPSTGSVLSYGVISYCQVNPYVYHDQWVIQLNAPGYSDNEYLNTPYSILNRSHTYASPGSYVLTYSIGALTCTVNVTVGPLILYNGNATGPFTDVVGNKFILTPVAPAGKTLSSVDWSIQNTTNGVADVYTGQATPTKSSGFVNTPFGTNGILNGAAAAAVTAYWGPYGGTQTIDATFHYTSGPPDTLASMPVTVIVPSGSVNTFTFGTPGLMTDENGQDWVTSGTATVGCSFYMNVDRTTTGGFGGNDPVVQVIDPIDAKTIYYTVRGNYWMREYFVNADGTKARPLLDDRASSSNVFYGGDISTTDNDYLFSDTPKLPYDPGNFLIGGDIFVFYNNTFTDILMFQPTTGVNGSGIYVPIAKLSWSWQAVWDAAKPDQVIFSTKPHVALPYAKTTKYPTWKGIASTYTDINNPIYWEHQIKAQ